MTTATAKGLDIEAIRRDFPILAGKARGKPLVYLDNAATTQKPTAVIEAVRDFYRMSNANVHRGVHDLSERATLAYEGARKTAARFLNAPFESEIIFTRGATEAINLVANSFGAMRVGAGDEILVTHMEHHSNIVPWQMLAERVGASVVAAPMNDRGELLLPEFNALLGPRTKLVSVVHVSNALGTVNPIREIIAAAHERDIPVVVDGAQAVHHLPVDVKALGADFYAFSGHKVYGPTGIGVLYGRREHLDAMPPWQGGGDMIEKVSFRGTTYAPAPAKFEAGTPNIAGAIGLAAALDYLTNLDLERVLAHETDLLAYGTASLKTIPGLRLIGTAKEKTSVLSFVMDGIHPHDIATVMDMQGVAVRAGHHCAQPVMDFFGVPATTRASLAVYNTREEIDVLIEALHEVRRLLG
jgi:cysteine desulfurase / selenocysteine lyase